LIDGFPRALGQAKYFEQNVVEATNVLYFDVDQETMTQRCMKRAETSGRSDDKIEVIKNRVQVYFNESVPVVEYYKQFGKVRHIDASGTINDIYAQAREGSLPEVFFMLGPKACGKSTVSQRVAQRTNMLHVDFIKFLLDNGLYGQDDETVTL
jgi:adenylate kinase family enzyme